MEIFFFFLYNEAENKKGMVMNMNNKNWVSVWGNAVSIAEHHPEAYAKYITLRYPVYIPFDGDTLRFTFDNYCGSEAVTVTRATVSAATSPVYEKMPLACPCKKETICDITFSKNESVTMEAHQTAVSDPVSFPVKKGMTLTVSLYFADFTLMQSAVLVTGPLSKGFFSLGDQTHADALPMDTTKTTNWFYFLSNIELMTAEENHTVICYGDSITAGAWPDYLTLLARQNPDNHTAFIRRATSGSRVLRQYECITYDSYGLKGTNRFPHEIPTTGADTVIIQQGSNDIIHPIGIETNPFRPMSDLPTAKELIDGYRYYIEEAKKSHLKVYMGTLLPIFGWRTYATFRDDLRNELNAWIRSAKEIDGCIDFDLALRGSENPSAFREGFDSGDHLHPSSKAYQAMAECAYEVLRK